MFISPLFSEVFHFLPSFHFLVLLWCPHLLSTHAPTWMVHLLCLRTNQHPDHPLYNHTSTCSPAFLDCLTLDDGTNRLSQNIGEQLSTYAA
jgi:hypothetical protein